MNVLILLFFVICSPNPYPALSSTEKSDINNLQAQISALVGLNGTNNGNNSNIGSDSIISI
jgi:hypothetical protein